MAKAGSHSKSTQSKPRKPLTTEPVLTHKAPVKPRALVLGPRGPADLIAQRLELQGFTAVFESELTEPLPRLSDADFLIGLKRSLTGFLKIIGESEGSYSHCIHPGLSLWAARPELPVVAQELGFGVVAPPVRVVSLFSNRLNFLAEADRLGIPHLVLSFDPLLSVREIEAVAPPDGAPYVLKSVRGSGEFGLQVIHYPEELKQKLPLWIEQLKQNYGQAMLIAEKYVESARHVIVPFARLRSGESRIFPFTDASLQSRYRKIIEFCPTPALSPKLEKQMRDWTIKMIESCGYVGVGSLEFMVDSDRAYLLGGLARLDTGFPLWEKVAGTHAVDWQWAALEGGGRPIIPACKPDQNWASGVSICLYAEDPLRHLPQPGVVREIPGSLDWKSDSTLAEAEFYPALKEGQQIDPGSEGLVGLLIAGGKDRKTALEMARSSLQSLWIAGSLQTNQRFIFELISHPWVREGIFHAAFADEDFVPEIRPSPEIMSLFVSVCAGLSSESQWVVGDRKIRADPDLLNWEAPPKLFQIADKNGLSGTLLVPEALAFKLGIRLRVCAFPIYGEKWQVRIGMWNMVVRKSGSVSQDISGEARKRELFAQVSGRVHSILFREGSRVPLRQPLVILESLRMLVPHAVPIDVTLLKWKIKPEQVVEAGQVLAELQLEP